MDQETPDTRSARRIANVHAWLDAKALKARRLGFFGELTISLKFEDGQCMLVETLVRERTK